MTEIRTTHWSIKEIESMSTDEIIAKLKSFNIDFDKDFVWMAVEVLWKRLPPHKINVEMIYDDMRLGYDLLEKRETKKAENLLGLSHNEP